MNGFSELKLAKFGLDGLGEYWGYHNPNEHWNGWQLPMFPKSEFMRFVNDLLQEYADTPEAYVADEMDKNPILPDLVSALMAPNSFGMYEFRNADWCWDSLPEEVWVRDVSEYTVQIETARYTVHELEAPTGALAIEIYHLSQKFFPDQFDTCQDEYGEPRALMAFNDSGKTIAAQSLNGARHFCVTQYCDKFFVMDASHCEIVGEYETEWEAERNASERNEMIESVKEYKNA